MTSYSYYDQFTEHENTFVPIPNNSRIPWTAILNTFVKFSSPANVKLTTTTKLTLYVTFFGRNKRIFYHLHKAERNETRTKNIMFKNPNQSSVHRLNFISSLISNYIRGLLGFLGVFIHSP